MALGALVAALGAFHYIDKGYAVSNAIKATETRLDVYYREAALKQERKATDATISLQKTAFEKEQKKNEDITHLIASRDALLKRLQDRPSRPPADTPITSPGEACTGSQLYRQDGEFLAREAARADQITIERNYYYDNYETARRKLCEFAKQGQDAGQHGEACDPKPVP